MKNLTLTFALILSSLIAFTQDYDIGKKEAAILNAAFDTGFAMFAVTVSEENLYFEATGKHSFRVLTVQGLHLVKLQDILKQLSYYYKNKRDKVKLQAITDKQMLLLTLQNAIKRNLETFTAKS